MSETRIALITGEAVSGVKVVRHGGRGWPHPAEPSLDASQGLRLQA
jgi:hypothetical protein